MAVFAKRRSVLTGTAQNELSELRDRLAIDASESVTLHSLSVASRSMGADTEAATRTSNSAPYSARNFSVTLPPSE